MKRVFVDSGAFFALLVAQDDVAQNPGVRVDQAVAEGDDGAGVADQAGEVGFFADGRPKGFPDNLKLPLDG